MLARSGVLGATRGAGAKASGGVLKLVILSGASDRVRVHRWESSVDPTVEKTPSGFLWDLAHNWCIVTVMGLVWHP
jgi:hypothetical protein